MFESNAPVDYRCPICLGISKLHSPDTLIRPSDFVFEDDQVAALLNSFFMGSNNAGHVIIVPKVHYESLYVLPDEIGHRIYDLSRHIAIAIKKAYKCDGIKIIQNNEPASDQHAFHYHLHVFPRYFDDGFNSVLPSQKILASPNERAAYADKIKLALDD